MRASALFPFLAPLALLLAACGADAAPGTDGPGAVFRKYRQAIRDGDVVALKACLAEEPLKEVGKLDDERVLGLVRAFVPPEEEVLGIEIDGDAATISLEAGESGQKGRGTVALVREDGAWRVSRESWDVGDLSEGGATGEPEAAEPPPAGWKPDGEWRLDSHEREIPDRPALGRANGKTFRVRFARLQNGILTLTDGDLFQWNAQFIVFLFLDEDEKVPAGRAFAFGPERDFSPGNNCHVHYHFKEGDGGTEVDSVVEGFSLKLEFGREKDGRIPGRLYLCYPDEARSYVAGRFTAKVE